MVNLIDEYYTKMRQIWIRKIFHNFEYDNNNNNNILTILWEILFHHQFKEILI